ncbi:hypothetical protein BU649_10450 [Staphylococcus chromogenes]|uniref:Phage head-tail adapter protein n=1 Tax=Staphylococcus chromogenes TaxID=46126 RepID=A0ABX5I7H5_STACR|nr:hypothetical protein [Staphylococcus chromogenes]PTG01836.1 hypothetical protein BU649_10450 [Staphylococcus chromogenes]PTG09746.1 hypothetical protein BU647_02830 [Staphylococcus chromogenes]PTG32019.1 hypothetical protein BU634_09330 [Staphylococcus chromogenes]PTG68285.1 hypothetical protein BU676_10390 [Staphylococcus chromogenes]RIL88747.1 hypothetical protein BUX98_10065 [Staphylococcus chromogenes]
MKIKARKIPVEVECVQFTDTESAKYIEEWSDAQVIYQVSKYQRILVVKTLEGEMNATINDYIVKGVNGEFYPVKPDIFHKTYEVLKDEK